MKKNILIWALVVFTFIILGSPLLYFGIVRSFFISIDPDVVYLTNALLYTKYAIISYADHPGTPSILILYYLFIPFRLYVKYILHTGFIQWSFDNYALLTYLARILMLAIYSSAIFIFLKTIQHMARSVYLVLFAWFSVMIFAGANYATYIGPENFSFFVTAFWLAVFWRFVKKPAYLLNFIIVAVAGFAVANKFTNLFLVFSSLFLPIFIMKMKPAIKIAAVGLNILTAGLTFSIGLFPARMQLHYIQIWVSALFYHTGMYGTGAQAIFNPSTYMESLVTLIRDNPLTFGFILLTIAMAIYLLVKKKLEIKEPVFLLLLLAILGIASFAKYPSIHYSFVNIILVISCSVYFLGKLGSNLTKKFLVAVSIIFVLNMWGNIGDTFSRLKKSPSETVNSVLSTWSPLWASDIFREQLDAVKP